VIITKVNIQKGRKVSSATTLVLIAIVQQEQGRVDNSCLSALIKERFNVDVNPLVIEELMNPRIENYEDEHRKQSYKLKYEWNNR